MFQRQETETNAPATVPQSTDNVDRPRPGKRARVAVACTRCKTRKQKCDGKQPRCGNCKNITYDCEYLAPNKAPPYGKYEYVKALEAKVAELQSFLVPDMSSDGGDSHSSKRLKLSDVNETVRLPPSALERRSTEEKENNAAMSDSRVAGEATSNEQATAVGHKRTVSRSDHGANTEQENACSNLTTGKILGSMIRVKELPHESVTSDSANTHLSPKSMSLTSELDDHEYRGSTILDQISPIIADRLFVGYIKHISTRWPILHTNDIRSLAARRLELRDPFEISTLSLVYAIGARFLETTGEIGAFWPEKHYQNAAKHMDIILQSHDIRTVQTLLLHAVYCLRAPRRPGAWTYIGLAMRTCIELGFHRRASSCAKPRLAVEMRRRIFWSCYCLDRQVSIILGRPFAISDRDIDAELPSDVDEASCEEQLEALDTTICSPRITSTSMSCFIHITKLRRIESSIQQCIYRVDKSKSVPISVLEKFLDELAAWKDRIPLDNRPILDKSLSSFDGDSYYLVYYYKTLRLLLYPHLFNKIVDQRILLKCVEASGAICQTYQKLHRQTSVGFSLMALYSIFLAGLTLIYCIWLSPLEVFTISANNDLNACSIVLYVITERWPGARKYRDAFDNIKQCVLDFIAAGNQHPRQPLTVLDDNLRATLEDVQNLHPEGKEDFGRMISDMLDETSSSPVFVKPSAGPRVGMGISEFQAQTLYGQQFVQQNMPVIGDGGEQMSEGFFNMPVGSIDLYDGFDMEEFLSNPIASWGMPSIPNQ